MATEITGQVIALAAIFQFATQVEQLAKTGYITTDELTLAVNSLLAQNPSNTLDVYGNIGNLLSGLTTILETLQRKPSKHSDCIRYVMGMLHLQKRLSKQPAMLNLIGSRLEKCQTQAQHFSPTHDNVIANLAGIYSDTISTFSFRIQVMGDYQYLQQTRIANQIRTLLFAGIRSAVLWRQLGGSRTKIILQRSRLLKLAQQLRDDAKRIQLL